MELALADDSEFVPLVTVLRDTLGDLTPENDRLRYVWPLTYTRPTVRQKLSGAIPFLYSRVGNKNNIFAKSRRRRFLILRGTDRDVWNKIFWTALAESAARSVRHTRKGFDACLPAKRERLSQVAHHPRAFGAVSVPGGRRRAGFYRYRDVRRFSGDLRLTDKTFGGLVGESAFATL